MGQLILTHFFFLAKLARWAVPLHTCRGGDFLIVCPTSVLRPSHGRVEEDCRTSYLRGRLKKPNRFGCPLDHSLWAAHSSSVGGLQTYVQ